MKIKWNKVTRLSQTVAIILFVGVFGLGIFLGKKLGVQEVLGNKVSDVVFQCEGNKNIHAIFYKSATYVTLSGGPELFLPQTISASGARYANDDESIVFWNKGNTAFVTEGSQDNMTYKNCVTK